MLRANVGIYSKQDRHPIQPERTQWETGLLPVDLLVVIAVIGESTALRIWQSLATPAGGEIVPATF